MAGRKRPGADKVSAFAQVAERHRRRGDAERALQVCLEGLEKFPEHLSGRVTLGWAYLDLGKYEEARAALEQVMRRAPDNLAAIRGLAELHQRSDGTGLDEMPEGWQADVAAGPDALAGARAPDKSAQPSNEARQDEALTVDHVTPELVTASDSAMASSTVEPALLEADATLTSALAGLEADIGVVETDGQVEPPIDDITQDTDETAVREAAQRAKREAAEQAEREAAEQAERDAAELAAREAAEQAEREATEQALRDAEAQAEREAAEEAARTAREAAEVAEREAAEQAEREAAEQAEREAAAQAERDAAEQAARDAQERAEREAAEKAARDAADKADREAAAQAAREAAEAAREAAAQAAREAAETAAREVAERVERDAAERAAREADEKTAREAAEQAERDAAAQVEREAREAREAAEHAEAEKEREEADRVAAEADRVAANAERRAAEAADEALHLREQAQREHSSDLADSFDLANALAAGQAADDDSPAMEAASALADAHSDAADLAEHMAAFAAVDHGQGDARSHRPGGQVDDDSMVDLDSPLFGGSDAADIEAVAAAFTAADDARGDSADFEPVVVPDGEAQGLDPELFGQFEMPDVDTGASALADADALPDADALADADAATGLEPSDFSPPTPAESVQTGVRAGAFGAKPAMAPAAAARIARLEHFLRQVKSRRLRAVEESVA